MSDHVIRWHVLQCYNADMKKKTIRVNYRVSSYLWVWEQLQRDLKPHSFWQTYRQSPVFCKSPLKKTLTISWCNLRWVDTRMCASMLTDLNWVTNPSKFFWIVLTPIWKKVCGNLWHWWFVNIKILYCNTTHSHFLGIFSKWVYSWLLLCSELHFGAAH